MAPRPQNQIPVDDVPIKRMGEFIPGEYVAHEGDDALEDARIFRISETGMALLVDDKLFGFDIDRLLVTCKAVKSMTPITVDELLELLPEA